MNFLRGVLSNRLRFREILKESLDGIFATAYSHMKDSIEAKLFGIGLDCFDATMNRIGACVIGARAVQKALLTALLEPSQTLVDVEDRNRLFERLAGGMQSHAMGGGERLCLSCRGCSGEHVLYGRNPEV